MNNTCRSDVAGHRTESALIREQDHLEKRIQQKQIQRIYQLRKERVIQGRNSERKEANLAEELSGDSARDTETAVGANRPWAPLH